MKIVVPKTRVAALAVFLLLNSAVGLFLVCIGYLSYLTQWYGPTLELTREYSRKLPDIEFDECEVSTDSWQDLTVDEHTTAEEAERIGTNYGSAMVRSVLSPETAEAFRDYILKANQELSEIALRFPQTSHRYHITPPHTEPTVRKVFKEIAEHPCLRLLVDSIVGPNSSLVNFSVLTSEYGAKDQPWHVDGGMSSSDYPDYFVKEFTLVVAMQDTNKDMGATGFCPGMRVCEDQDEEGYYFLDDEDVDCPMQAVMSQGDVFLYSSDLYHRGTAHKDANAPPRVFAFITFAESRRGPDDKRAWPIGTDRLLDWRMFGHTIDDLATMEERPWRLWHTFGLFNGKGGNVRPWNLIDYVLNLYVDRSNEAVSVTGVEFVADDLDDKVDILVWYYGVFIAMYILIVVPLVVVVFPSIPSGGSWSTKQNRTKTVKTM